jgi:hypothetical protein
MCIFPKLSTSILLEGELNILNPVPVLKVVSKVPSVFSLVILFAVDPEY